MNVLVVDDHPTNRKLLRAILEDAGLGVVEATDGVEALEILQHQSIDAIVSDIMMPRMDGYRLCLEVRKHERFRAIPFIVCTSTFSSPGDEALAGEMGADRYIRKPAPPQMILNAIRETAARRGPAPVPKLESQQEVTLMQEYSAQLVSKLEERNIKLTQLTAELQITHQKLQHLLAHSPAVLYTLKFEGRKIIPHVVGENIQTLLGFTAEETNQHEWWVNQLHPEDAERAIASFSETVRGDLSRVEYRLRHKDGNYRWVEDSRRVVPDPSGQAKDIVGIWVDISQRKAAEEELRRQTAELARSNEELTRFNRLTMGREMRMIELKKQVNELSQQLGKTPPYDLNFAPETSAGESPVS